MLGKLRRLANLYKLLWTEDRIDNLEAKVARLYGSVQDQGQSLQSQIQALQGRIDVQQRQIASIEQRTWDQTKHLADQLDALKSSLEVSKDLVEDFFEWKAANPLPAEPLVSVAVATYNRSRLLTERCIPSVLNQTYRNLELIVVGDGCTDDTEKAVNRIKDPRLRFVNLSGRSEYPKNSGLRWMVAGTRPTNEALSMARGDFIAHLDDDDEYVPDRLEKLVGFALEHDCDFVWHPFWWEMEDESWRVWEAPEFAYGQVTNASVLYRSWFKRFESDIDAHRLIEPGDWNRFRKIKYVDPVSMRYPEPLSLHYRERNRS